MTAGIKFDWHKAYGASDVPSSVRSVAYVVWDYTDAHGNGAHPGIDRIVASTGLSKRQALRNLAENVARGWLGQLSSGSNAGKAGSASEYRLTYPDGHAKQVSSVSPALADQVSSVSPAGPDQVTSVTKPGVISVTPTDPLTTTAVVRTEKPEPLPDHWAPNDAHRRDALKRNHDVDALALKFRNWAVQKNERLRDWDMRFSMWIADEKQRPQAVPRSGNAGGRLWQE